jgi:uncharacterized surface protein with fasciclin (FAS1) repeats
VLLRAQPIRTYVLVVLATLSLAIGLGGCGGDDSGPKFDPAAVSTAVPTDPNGLFGHGCRDLPKSKSNPASPAAMTGVPLRTAVERNPRLSTMIDAVRKAGMADAFDNAKGITVLLPTNDAFKKVPTLQMKFAMSNKSLLRKILTFHVIEKTLTPEQLNTAGPFTTMQGSQLRVRGFGEALRMGEQNSHVICGNIHATNATLYLVDTVLLPT